MSNTWYMPLEKSETSERIVHGIFTTPEPDSEAGVWEGQRYEGDVVTSEAIDEAIADYAQWSNIREMHQPVAAGRALKIEKDGDKRLITARIVDDSAWEKVKEQVYKGFSIGGKVLAAYVKKVNGRWLRFITKLRLTEISLVDRPANHESRILFFKRSGGHMLIDMDLEKKAEPNMENMIGQMQTLRNSRELTDPEAAETMTQIIRLMSALMDGDTEVEEEVAPPPMAEGEAAMVEAMDNTAMADTKVAKGTRMRMVQRRDPIYKMAQEMMRIAAAAEHPMAIKVLKMMMDLESPTVNTEMVETMKSAAAANEKVIDILQKMAAGINYLDTRLSKVESEPMPTPARTTAAITKRLTVAGATDNIAEISDLQMQIASQRDPSIRASLKARLQKLTGGQY